MPIAFNVIPCSELEAFKNIKEKGIWDWESYRDKKVTSRKYTKNHSKIKRIVSRSDMRPSKKHVPKLSYSTVIDEFVI